MSGIEVDLDEIKRVLDIEVTRNHKNALLTKYYFDGIQLFNEQLGLIGEDPLTVGNLTDRQKTLMEDFVIGKYIHLNKPEHSISSREKAERDIKTHVKSKVKKETEDGISTGSNQFAKTTGNVRKGNGL